MLSSERRSCALGFISPAGYFQWNSAQLVAANRVISPISIQYRVAVFVLPAAAWLFVWRLLPADLLARFRTFRRYSRPRRSATTNVREFGPAIFSLTRFRSLAGISSMDLKTRVRLPVDTKIVEVLYVELSIADHPTASVAAEIVRSILRDPA
jgi:hypothetical protein